MTFALLLAGPLRGFWFLLVSIGFYCLQQFGATPSVKSHGRPNQLKKTGTKTKTARRRFLFLYPGAQERTRTSTKLPSLAPEASASTNSATWAGCVCYKDRHYSGGKSRVKYFDIALAQAARTPKTVRGRAARRWKRVLECPAAVRWHDGISPSDFPSTNQA